MATEKDVEILLSTCEYDGVPQPMVVGYSWRWSKTYIPIRGQGSTDPKQQGLIARMLVCTIQFLTQPVFDDTETPATIGIVTKTCEANSMEAGECTDTLQNLIPTGLAKQVNRESPPFVYEQDFILKGDAVRPTSVVA